MVCCCVLVNAPTSAPATAPGGGGCWNGERGLDCPEFVFVNDSDKPDGIDIDWELFVELVLASSWEVAVGEAGPKSVDAGAKSSDTEGLERWLGSRSFSRSRNWIGVVAFDLLFQNNCN